MYKRRRVSGTVRISAALNEIDTRTQSLQDKQVNLTAEIDEVKMNLTTTLGGCGGSGATSCSDLQTAVGALTVQANYDQVAAQLTSQPSLLCIVHDDLRVCEVSKFPFEIWCTCKSFQFPPPVAVDSSFLLVFSYAVEFFFKRCLYDFHIITDTVHYLNLRC